MTVRPASSRRWLALLPIVALGLAMWRDQATYIWLSGIVATCF